MGFLDDLRGDVRGIRYTTRELRGSVVEGARTVGVVQAALGGHINGAERARYESRHYRAEASSNRAELGMYQSEDRLRAYQENRQPYGGPQGQQPEWDTRRFPNGAPQGQDPRERQYYEGYGPNRGQRVAPPPYAPNGAHVPNNAGNPFIEPNNRTDVPPPPPPPSGRVAGAPNTPTNAAPNAPAASATAPTNTPAPAPAAEAPAASLEAASGGSAQLWRRRAQPAPNANEVPRIAQNQVQALQEMLIAAGQPVGTAGADGKYGPDTHNAILAVAQRAGITDLTTIDFTAIDAQGRMTDPEAQRFFAAVSGRTQAPAPAPQAAVLATPPASTGPQISEGTPSVDQNNLAVTYIGPDGKSHRAYGRDGQPLTEFDWNAYTNGQPWGEYVERTYEMPDGQTGSGPANGSTYVETDKGHYTIARDAQGTPLPSNTNISTNHSYLTIIRPEIVVDLPNDLRRDASIRNLVGLSTMRGDDGERIEFNGPQGANARIMDNYVDHVRGAMGAPGMNPNRGTARETAALILAAHNNMSVTDPVQDLQRLHVPNERDITAGVASMQQNVLLDGRISSGELRLNAEAVRQVAGIPQDVLASARNAVNINGPVSVGGETSGPQGNAAVVQNAVQPGASGPTVG